MSCISEGNPSEHPRRDGFKGEPRPKDQRLIWTRTSSIASGVEARSSGGLVLLAMYFSYGLMRCVVWREGTGKPSALYIGICVAARRKAWQLPPEVWRSGVGGKEERKRKKGRGRRGEEERKGGEGEGGERKKGRKEERKKGRKKEEKKEEKRRKKKMGRRAKRGLAGAVCGLLLQAPLGPIQSINHHRSKKNLFTSVVFSQPTPPHATQTRLHHPPPAPTY